MALQSFRARVADYKQWSPRYQSIHLELIEPHRIEFAAGQYIMLKVPGVVGVRQYSIASAPSMDHGIELLADIVPGGKGSTYLASLKPGDAVEFMAPAGAFTIKSSTSSIGSKSSKSASEEQLVFVATGSGIAPIRSMITDLLIDKKDARQMWLYWGMRHAEDIFWFDNFARLAEEYESFNFDMVLSKPPDGWELCEGRVTDCLAEHEHTWESGKIGAYICGNKKMIDEVQGWFVKQNIAPERIHYEQFY